MPAMREPRLRERQRARGLCALPLQPRDPHRGGREHRRARLRVQGGVGRWLSLPHLAGPPRSMRLCIRRLTRRHILRVSQIRAALPPPLSALPLLLPSSHVSAQPCTLPSRCVSRVRSAMLACARQPEQPRTG
eukprot:1346385-Rhodomonas_salina.4